MTGAPEPAAESVIASNEELISALAAHADLLTSLKSAVNELNGKIARLAADLLELERKLPDR